MKKLKYLLIPGGFLFFLMLVYSLGTYNNQFYFILKHILMFAFLGSLILVSQFILHDIVKERTNIKGNIQVGMKLSIGVFGFLLLWLVGNMQLNLVKKETPFVVACDYYTMEKELIYKSYGDTCATVQKYNDNHYVFHEDVEIDDVQKHYMTSVKFTYDENNNRSVNSYIYVTSINIDQVKHDLYKIVQTTYEELDRLYIKNEVYKDEYVGVISALDSHIYEDEPEVYTWMVAHNESGSGSVGLLYFEDNDEDTLEYIARKTMNDSYTVFTGYSNYHTYNYFYNGVETGQSLNFSTYEFTYPSSRRITFEERVKVNGAERRGNFSYNEAYILDDVREITLTSDTKENIRYTLEKENSNLYIGGTYFYRVNKVSDGSLFKIELLLNVNNGFTQAPWYLYDKEMFEEFHYPDELFRFEERARDFYFKYNPIFNRFVEGVPKDDE